MLINKIAALWRKESRTEILLLLLTVAPSLLIVLVPVYEADVTALMSRPADHDFAFWLSFGRPALYPIVMPLMALARWIGLPGAAHLFGFVFMALFAIWLMLLARALTTIMGSRCAAVFAACFMGLHFHFYESRMWSGSNVLLASMPLIIVFIAAHQGRMRWLPLLLASAGVMFLSLNLHQSGAFFIVALAGLGLCSGLLSPEPGELRQIVKRYTPLAIGTGLACIFYGIEVLLIRQTVGMVNRSESGAIGQNLFGFVKKLFLWGPAIIPLPLAVRQVPWLFAIATLAILALAWRSVNDIPLWRKTVAIMIVLTACVGSCLPTIATGGVYSSRVLLGSLVALWGGVAIALNRGHWQNSSRYRTIAYLTFAAAWICHLWGFSLVVGIKHLPVPFTEQMRSELKSAGVKSGDTIIFYGQMPETKSVAWSDSGIQVYAAPWGAESMLTPILTQVSLPQPLNFAAVHTDAPSTAPIVTRPAPGHFQVNGYILATQQLNLEKKFCHPFNSPS